MDAFCTVETAKYPVTYQQFADHDGEFNFDFSSITKKLGRIGQAIETTESELSELNSNLISFRKISTQEFQGDKQIEELENKIAELTDQIAHGGKEEQKKEVSNSRSM